mmetsp:Transcript_868/g.2244  ORF Transcript_868/g.2244 Transcript_868/m.2244 type:complete len:203 (-) Transcript_868:3653-4261(-)
MRFGAAPLRALSDVATLFGIFPRARRPVGSFGTRQNRAAIHGGPGPLRPGIVCPQILPLGPAEHLPLLARTRIVQLGQLRGDLIEFPCHPGQVLMQLLHLHRLVRHLAFDLHSLHRLQRVLFLHPLVGLHQAPNPSAQHRHVRLLLKVPIVLRLKLPRLRLLFRFPTVIHIDPELLRQPGQRLDNFAARRANFGIIAPAPLN